MAYSDIITRIPAPTGSGDGVGLTAPILKALTHAAVILTHDSQETLDREAITTEVSAITDHLTDDRLLNPPYASTVFATSLSALREAATAMRAEYTEWSDETLRQNIGLLVTRSVSICGMIDRELAGIENAAAGDRL